MQSEISRSLLAGLEIEFTEKALTGWGGLALVAEFFRRIELRELLSKALPDGRTSPNQRSVVDIAMSQILNVLTGGSRFAHVERLRFDQVLRTMFEIEVMPSATTVTRYFGGFVRRQSERLAELFDRYVANQLKSPAEGEVLDLDSTVNDRYGEQEGSRKGYNPRRPGRPSHHPILAMLAHSKVILHTWLRSGDASPMRGAVEFLGEVLAKLPESFSLRAVRADSGFFSAEFLSALEEHNLLYAVAVRARRDIQNLIRAVSEWTPGQDGRREFGEFTYQPSPRKPARRMVVVRQKESPTRKTPGKKLFLLPGYVYHIIVTNMTLTPEQAWEFYKGRADCENRIKELKYDFAAGGFCMQSFFGTKATFRLICFLFNLMAIFSDELLGNPARRLSTTRADVFVSGAVLGQNGRQPVLRLGLTGRSRERFKSLSDKLKLCVFSTASQLIQSLKNHALDPPTPWRIRARKQSFVVLFAC